MSWLARFPRFAREVVAQRVALAATGSVLLHLALAQHWITPALSATITADVQWGINGAVLLIAAWSVRKAVTPLASPRDSTGQPLTVPPSGFDAGQNITLATPMPTVSFDAPTATLTSTTPATVTVAASSTIPAAPAAPPTA